MKDFLNFISSVSNCAERVTQKEDGDCHQGAHPENWLL